MARIDIKSAGGGGSVATGVLQLQGGVAMTSTLTAVTDQNNTTSPLKLSTTAVQVVSPFRISTDDPSDMYLDCEDGSTNNRFNITRNTASQQVNLNFASNPGGGSAIVGAIRTFVDDVNLSEVMQFREDGRIQIGSTAASAMYWDNTNNRLGVGTNTPVKTLNVVGGDVQIGSSLTSGNFNPAAYRTFTIGTDYGSGALQIGSGTTGLMWGGLYANISNVAVYSNSRDLTFETPSEAMRIDTSRNVGIGVTTVTARLQVKGSGSTSATTSLLVQNSAGTTSLKIPDDGIPQIGSTGLNGKIQFNRTSDGGAIASVGAFNNLLVFTEFSGSGFRFDDGYGTFPLFMANSRVSINRGSISDASAQLQIDSTTRGFLPPRMTNAQRLAIASPAVGLMVYCTDAVEGLYVYKSTGWTFVI
jgi:hypothetical protein